MNRWIALYREDTAMPIDPFNLLIFLLLLMTHATAFNSLLLCGLLTINEKNEKNDAGYQVEHYMCVYFDKH